MVAAGVEDFFFHKEKFGKIYFFLLIAKKACVVSKSRVYNC